SCWCGGGGGRGSCRSSARWSRWASSGTWSATTSSGRQTPGSWGRRTCWAWPPGDCGHARGGSAEAAELVPVGDAVVVAGQQARGRGLGQGGGVAVLG